MGVAHSRRLRISSCIRTIIDVHSRLSKKYGSAEMLEKFKQLEKTVNRMDNPHISEWDVRRVEKATNRLFEEMKLLRKFGEMVENKGKPH